MATGGEEPDIKRRKMSSSSRVTNISTASSVTSSAKSSVTSSAKSSVTSSTALWGNGNDDTLTTDIDIVSFARHRVKELIAMSKVSRSVSGNKLPQQLIPVHMRRRAMSHNVKRLPRRLRQAAMRENIRNPRTTTKRPSRKHRRRPSNLLAEYMRRQRSKKWLETHIWHAKRFHMTEKWGFKIALHPNDKGARAAYRASVKHCLLQDVSFLTCIEIKGNQSDVADRLNRLTSKDVGLRFGAAAYKKGQREGSIVVYEADKFPRAAIGPVQFMWKPQVDSETDSSNQSLLWVWAHPSLLNTLLRNILLVLDIKPVSLDLNANKQTPDGIVEDGDKDKMEVESEIEKSPNKAKNNKLKDKGNSVAENAKKTDKANGQKNTKANDKKNEKNKSASVNADSSSETNTKNSSTENLTSSDISSVFKNDDFTVKLLDRELCRFQLTGPLSQVVLARTLEVASVSHVNCEGENTKLDDSTSLGNDSVFESSDALNKNKKKSVALPNSASETTKWWQEHFAPDSVSELHEAQRRTWRHLTALSSPAELPPHCVVGLTVTDPRLQLPVKKGKVYPDIEDWNADFPPVCPSQMVPEICYSPLWEEMVRREVSETKISEQQLNQLRAKNLVPGSRLNLGDEASRVPVLLIQRPGNYSPEGGARAGRTGTGCGWDLILPARWAMAFWVPLVYRGARVCGLRDTSELCSSQGVLHFPSHYPDADAGRRHQNDVTAAAQTKYSKRPPSKRPNYYKYGVAAPFSPPWKQLVGNWCKSKETSETAAKVLESGKEQKSKEHSSNTEEISCADLETEFFVLRDRRLLKVLASLCQERNPKKLVTVERKLVESMLSEETYKKALVPVHIEMVSKGRPNGMSMICVPTAEDLKEFQGSKTEWQPPVEPKHKVPRKPAKAKTKAKTKELKKKRQAELEEKRLKDVEDIRFGCCREIGGFVCSGGFHLPTGHGEGVGFMALPALKVLLELRDETALKSRKKVSNDNIMVLVRNSTSLQYRCAYLNVFHSSIKLC